MHNEENIIRLHTQFKQLKTYKEKVGFFDLYFGCLPHQYPAFDPELKFLFEQKEFDVISELFEKERRKAILLDKRYQIQDNLYIFNATPVNSNTVILNDYILYNFINNDKRFESEIKMVQEKEGRNQEQIWESWLSALNRIDSIQNKLDGGEERGLRYRFMNVFINGYRDREKGLLKKFYNRRKIIELYLYAQGALFRQYYQELNEACDFSGSAIHDEPLQSKTSELRILTEYIRRHFLL